MSRAQVTRGVTAATVGLFLAACSVGFGLVSPAAMADTIVSPAPVNSLSSELAAMMDGGATAAEAASAGTAGTVAAASGPGVAIAGAAVGSFSIAAGVAGFILRATGSGTAGFCSDALGRFVGPAYGQDCSTASIKLDPSYKPNADATGGQTTGVTCSAGGAPCGTLALSTAATATSQYLILTVGFTSGSGADFGTYPSAYVQRADGSVVSTTIQQGPKSAPDGTLLVPAGKWAAVFDYPASDTRYATIKWASLDPGSDPANSPGGGTVTTAPADPGRFWETTATFSDGSTLTADSLSFKESDSVIPQYPTIAVPPGKTITSLVVTEWLVDRSASKVVQQYHTSPEYQAAATAYPDCASGSCVLQVYVHGHACTLGASACVDWIHQDAGAEDIQCMYGPAANPTEYNPPLAECNVLAPYYNPTTVGAGSPLANPKTGTPITDPTGPSSKPTSVGSAASGKDCFGSSITANPLTWVTGPVECALQWAFVPDPTAVQSDVAGVQTAWKQSAPVTVIDGVTGFMGNLPAGSGCSGIHVTWPSLDWGKAGKSAPIDINVLNACTDPAATLAAGSRLLIDISLGIFTFMSLTRFAGGTIAFPGMGGKGSE